MTVILSPEAARQLEHLFEYLENEWSPEVRSKFQRRFYRFVNTIKLMPKAFPSSNTFPGCRKCVVSKQTSIYYRFLEQESVIQIITVWDNRMNLPPE